MSERKVHQWILTKGGWPRLKFSVPPYIMNLQYKKIKNLTDVLDFDSLFASLQTELFENY